MLLLLLLFVVQLAMSAGASKSPSPRYSSLQDASEQYAVPVKTLRDWIAKGRLKGYRLGPRQIRVDLDDMDKLCRPVPAARPPQQVESA